MSHRIHFTAAADLLVEVGSGGQIAEIGAEIEEDDENEFFLLLNDVGNLEAFALSGSTNDWRLLAQRIIAAADRDDRYAAQAGAEAKADG